MTERPILFSGAMVRAILSGMKVQTRRVLKPQPAPNAPHDGGTSWMFRPELGRHMPYGTVGHLAVKEKMGLLCPYGLPGDRLWVRETWGIWQRGDSTPGGQPYDPSYLYRASHDAPDDIPKWAEVEPFRWRPSIHMPRRACRLVLEVVSVRVERLQDISEEDARAEGAERIGVTFQDRADGTRVVPSLGGPYRDGFRILWESINGPGAWEANPWVWCVEFRRAP